RSAAGYGGRRGHSGGLQAPGRHPPRHGSHNPQAVQSPYTNYYRNFSNTSPRNVSALRIEARGQEDWLKAWEENVEILILRHVKAMDEDSYVLAWPTW
ncbi:hypothetical protein ACLOJK_037309, partial [Asimina triloba]